MKDYQVRLASIVKDFGAPQGADGPIDVERYRGKVPDVMIEFWQQNGIGIILNGYFQFCDPDKYASIMKFVFDGDPDIEAEKTHVLGFGAFGTIFAWNEVYQNVDIDLVGGKVSCQALIDGETYDPNIAVTSSLMLLDGSTFDEYDSNARKLFKPACSKLGKLGTGKIYGFRPVLALGGNRDLESLTIYNALPHMAIMAQVHQLELMDNDPFPPQRVRGIGA